MRHLLNILKLCEKYDTHGIDYGYVGRKTTHQKDHEVLKVHVPYPDIDWCAQTKMYISYDDTNDLIYVSQNITLGKNYWVTQFLDDVKNSRIDVKDYYIYDENKR